MYKRAVRISDLLTLYQGSGRRREGKALATLRQDWDRHLLGLRCYIRQNTEPQLSIIYLKETLESDLVFLLENIFCHPSFCPFRQLCIYVYTYFSTRLCAYLSYSHTHPPLPLHPSIHPFIPHLLIRGSIHPTFQTNIYLPSYLPIKPLASLSPVYLPTFPSS